MPSIEIRNVPDDVHRELRVRAAREGKSMSEFLLGELTRIAAHPPREDALLRATAREADIPIQAILDALDQGRAGG